MATSKPSRLPAIIELAARVRAGETVDSVAASCGVARVTILNRFSDAGFTFTGEEKQVEARSELKAYLARVARTWLEPWMDDAACARVDPEAWYPEVGVNPREAKKICSGCPALQLCLDYALRNNERVGIWGGTTPTERRKIWKEAGHDQAA